MASILLPVPQILQNPELPNGCEITSCCEVLHYLGFAPDKCELADYYLPRSAQWYGADPDEVYMGNPHLDDGSPAALLCMKPSCGWIIWTIVFDFLRISAL